MIDVYDMVLSIQYDNNYSLVRFMINIYKYIYFAIVC